MLFTGKVEGEQIKQYSHTHVKLSNHLLFRMLASYILVALMPLLLNIGMYYRHVESAVESERKSVAALLSQSCDAYDEAVAELDNIFATALSEKELRDISSSVNPLIDNGKVYHFLQAQQRMKLLSRTSSLVDDLILYNVPGKFAITAKTTFLNIELLPASMEKNYIGIAWPDNFFDQFSVDTSVKRRWISLPDKTGSNAIMLFANTLYWGNYSNILFAVISPSSLKNYLYSDGTTDIVVLDSDGSILSGNTEYVISHELLSSIDDFDVITAEDGQKYMICVHPSTVTTQQFYSVTPYAAIEESAVSLRTTIIMMVLTVILTTLILCVAFVWINLRPIDKIMALLFGSDASSLPNSVDWTNMGERIRSILAENSTLNSDINAQSEYLKNNLIYDLINNRDDNPERILRRMEKLKIPYSDSYWLLTIELPHGSANSDPAAQSLLLHKLISHHISDIFNVSDLTSRRYVVIVSTERHNDADMRSAFSELHTDMLEGFGLDIRGCLCMMDTLVSIPHAYRNEIISLEGAEDDAGGLVECTSGFDDDQEIYYPARLEQQLSAAINVGDDERVRSVLDELYHENFATRHLSDAKMAILWERIYNNVSLAIMKMKSIPDELLLKTLSGLRKGYMLESYIDMLNSMLAVLNPVFIIVRTDSAPGLHHTELGARIVDYIRKNMADANLCLSLVADNFDLSTTYVSMLVKDETGDTFSVYCEKLRIASACDMLREGRQIQDVAESVGYCSAHTFRRVFKKITGVLPSQYEND